MLMQQFINLSGFHKLEFIYLLVLLVFLSGPWKLTMSVLKMTSPFLYTWQLPVSWVHLHMLMLC